MGPQHLKFGGGASGTMLHPVVAIATALAAALIIFGPRRFALASFITAAILTPTDQVIVLAGVHFPILRVLAIVGLFRVIREKTGSGRRVFSGGINRIDIAVILLTALTALNGTLLFGEAGELINQVGNLLTVFGTYFLLRLLIREEADILTLVRTIAYVAVIVSAVMCFEVATGHSPYALLGGARASLYAALAQRDNRFRGQGPFSHSILAGTFGAVILPLFMTLWWQGGRHRRLASIGILASTIIVIASNSSTPVLAYAAGILALCLWRFRGQLPAFRWTVLASLIPLQLAMKNPVWHLITRIDITGGSSSWHRYMLIDQCIRHFGDWWLLGVKDTSSWGWDMWDTANQYVNVAENSGLLPLAFFIATIIYAFKYLRTARLSTTRGKEQLFLWSLSAALFSNTIAFLGISIFDQTMVVWYGLLAAVCATRASGWSLQQESTPAAPLIPELPLDDRDVINSYC